MLSIVLVAARDGALSEQGDGPLLGQGAVPGIPIPRPPMDTARESLVFCAALASTAPVGTCRQRGPPAGLDDAQCVGPLVIPVMSYEYLARLACVCSWPGGAPMGAG
jgi:hypothetical protein